MGKPIAIPKMLELYTIAETAAILNVSRRTVTQWISDGALPACRLGPAKHLVRVRAADLEAFIAKGQVGNGCSPVNGDTPGREPRQSQ